MPPRLAQAKVDRIVCQLAANESIQAVANAENVTKETVRRISINIEAFGSPYAPSFVRQGRPKLLTRAMEEALLDYLLGRPDAFLDEQQYWLWDSFGVQPSLSTIQRTLRDYNWTNKKLKKRASERKPILRAA